MAGARPAGPGTGSDDVATGQTIGMACPAGHPAEGPDGGIPKGDGGGGQWSSRRRGGKVSQPWQPGHCQKYCCASKPQAAQR